MNFIEDKIINILKNLPNESNYLDYKQIPYFKEKKPAFIKDIIAFLNSKEALEKDKFIIIGVTDKLELMGLPKNKQMLDDASYQTWITTHITPQPIIETGSISYKEKTFGYIYIPATKNNQHIYEVKSSCINNNKENNIVLQGQSFGRTGSQNKVLFQKDRVELLSAIERNNQRFTNLEPIYLSQDSDSSIPVFIVACMLGSWNERYPKDIELIETLSNRTYSDFKNLILSLQKQYPAQIQYQLSEWTFANNIDNFEEISSKFKIDYIYNLLNKTLDDIFKNFNKNDGYSYTLRIHILEFFSAMIYKYNFLNPRDKEGIKNKIISKFFTYDYEDLYTILKNNISFVIEIYPSLFLEYLSIKLSSKISQISTNFNCDKYYILINNIISLGFYDRYLNLSIKNLFTLSQYDENCLKYLATLIRIVTIKNRNFEQIEFILNDLFKMNDNLAWSLLLEITGYFTTTINPIQFKYLKKIDINNIDYFNLDVDTTNFFYNQLFKKATNNVNRLSILLQEEYYTSDNRQLENLIQILSKNLDSFNIEDKYLLWLKSKMLIYRKKYFYEKDTNYNLNLNLDTLNKILDESIPDTSEIENYLYFTNSNDMIYSDDINYNKLSIQQKSIIQNIYYSSGLDGIIEFAKKVENPCGIFSYLSDFIIDDDAITFVDIFLRDYDNTQKYLYHGILNNEHIFHIILKSLTNDLDKAKILRWVYLDKDLLNTINSLSKNAQLYYWENTDLFSLTKPNNYLIIDDIIDNLMQANRFADVIQIFVILIINNNKETSYLKISNALKNMDIDTIRKGNLDYYLKKLISWLIIHCSNLELLEELLIISLKATIFSSKIQIEYFDKKLLTSSKYYINLLEKIYSPIDFNERHVYQNLLTNINIDNAIKKDFINIDSLCEWINNVLSLGKKKHIYSATLHYIGTLLINIPGDKDGFFIDKKIATLIETLNSKILIDAYKNNIESSNNYIKIFNLFNATLDEKINILQKKASECRNNGFWRLSEMLERIAENIQ